VERVAGDDYFFVGEEAKTSPWYGRGRAEDFYGARAVAEIRLRSKVIVGRVTCMDFSSAK